MLTASYPLAENKFFYHITPKAETNLPQLSPPELTYLNVVKNSIGRDSFVNVGDLIQLPNEEYMIPVDVGSFWKARALAVILENRRA